MHSSTTAPAPVAPWVLSLRSAQLGSCFMSPGSSACLTRKLCAKGGTNLSKFVSCWLHWIFSVFVVSLQFNQMLSVDFFCVQLLNPPCILVIFLCSKCSECFLSTMFVEILSVFYYLFLEIIQKFTSTTFLFLEITSNSYHLLMWLYWMFYFLFLFLLHYTISISNCFNDT